MIQGQTGQSTNHFEIDDSKDEDGYGVHVIIVMFMFERGGIFWIIIDEGRNYPGKDIKFPDILSKWMLSG